jgi:hypothetical protein
LPAKAQGGQTDDPTHTIISKGFSTFCCSQVAGEARLPVTPLPGCAFTTKTGYACAPWGTQVRITLKRLLIQVPRSIASRGARLVVW